MTDKLSPESYNPKNVCDIYHTFCITHATIEIPNKVPVDGHRVGVNREHINQSLKRSVYIEHEPEFALSLTNILKYINSNSPLL